MSEFIVEDSGNKKTFTTGMVRNSDKGKVRYNSILHGPMFKRWAAHVWKAKAVYPDVALGLGNWELAETAEELQHAKESLLSHIVDYLETLDAGVEAKEDNAAAVFFNINLIENIKLKMAAKKPQTTDAAVNRNYAPKLPGTDIRDLPAVKWGNEPARPFPPPWPPVWHSSPPNTPYPAGTILCNGQTTVPDGGGQIAVYEE